jgi:hypothetical protein
MAKVKVTDPSGEQWTVGRWWFTAIPWESGIAFIDMIIFVIVLPFMLAWPFWLLLKWLGVPWSIVVKRGDTKVGEEKVRGWKASGARIDEIARLVQAGTPPQYAAA